MLVKMVTATGEEHGLINVMANHVPDKGDKDINPKIKSAYEKKRKDDSVMVKARYLNHRNRLERLDKPYCKYSGDPIKIYHLIPGYEYDLPMGFVEEVNAVKVPVRGDLVSVGGENMNNGAPTKGDTVTQIHELIPCSF